MGCNRTGPARGRLWHATKHGLWRFNEDGHEDVLVFEGQAPCDPYPPDYDPAWYRFSLFVADSFEGLMQDGGTFPLGGIPRSGARVDDFDDDGHLDLMLHVYHELGPLLIRGDGNGGFVEPEKMTTGELSWVAGLGARAQWDGVGRKEFLFTNNDTNVTYAIEDNLDIGTVAVFVDERRYMDGIADVNGDGVMDYMYYKTCSDENPCSNGHAPRILMISAP